MREANHGVFGDEGQDTLHDENGANDPDGGLRADDDFDVPGILHGDAGADTSLATGRFSRRHPRRPDQRRPAPQGFDRGPTGSRSATGHDAK
jgi:hypothetical protein